MPGEELRVSIPHLRDFVISLYFMFSLILVFLHSIHLQAFYHSRSHVAPEGRSTPKFDHTMVASEVTDEKTTLLEAEGGSLHSHPPQGDPQLSLPVFDFTIGSSTGS